MSIRVLSWVWEHSLSEGTDRLVLLALADQARDEDNTAWPSIETIAKKAKVSPRTVQRSIRALQLLGEVTVDENAGRRGTNVYRICTDPRLTDTPDIVTSPSDSHPRQNDTVTPVTRRGDTRVARTVKNRQLPPNPPPAGGKVPEHCDHHSKFRKGCDRCAVAVRDAARHRDEHERRRSAAILDELAEARARSVPRPKEDTA